MVFVLNWRKCKSEILCDDAGFTGDSPMEMRSPEEVNRLLTKYHSRYSCQPKSYPIKDKVEDTKPSRWISQAWIWEERGSTTTIHKPYSPHKFKTKEEANNFALYLAADWLDNNAV